MGAPAYVIHACLSLLIAVFLTFGENAVYNMDSKQRVEAASLHNAAYYSLLSAFSKFSLLP